MRKNSGKIIIFLLSIFLGILISLNSNFVGIKKYFSLNSKEYNDAVMERNDLYKQIESLKKNNKNTKLLINNYEKDDKKDEKSDEEVLKIMKEQTNHFGMLIGSTPVQGEGLLLEISDGDIYNGNNNVEISNRIFHDRDLELVLNELRKAGAEAIMINNHRITPATGLSCNGPFIVFEDEHTEYAPFYIYAIGNPEEMEASLLSDESHIKELQLRELNIVIKKMKDIKMPAAMNIGKVESMTGFVEKNKN